MYGRIKCGREGEMKNTVGKDGGNSIVQYGTVKSQEGRGMR